MNLTSKKEITEILEKYETKPIKGLGQNFLINKDALNKIVSFAKPKGNIVEIGPGIGALTKDLSKVSKKIIAIEKDRKMIEILRETLKDCLNVEIIHEDVLKIKKTKFKNYDVISNLPYYIAAAIIRKFLEFENPPDKMILTVQKELAQRICSSPPRMNVLAISVQFYATCKVVFNISKNSFWPQPKVNSSVIEIIPCNHNHNKEFCIHFFKIVKAGFSRPRAQLLNNISKKLKLEKKDVNQIFLLSSINPKQRAETLSVNDWIKLSKNITFK